MRHVPEFDGLRAVAAIAVVIFHCAPVGALGWLPGGALGVDLFFVLSAYLITRILVTEWNATGSIDLRRFYWRRFWRLTPALFAMLLAYAIAAPFVWPDYPHGRDALVTGLYLSDYAQAFWDFPFYLRHTWSLAVEEHFYLLWPLLLPFVLRRPLLILAVAWVAMMIWRQSADAAYYRFDTHATGLILGAALAFAPSRPIPTVVAAGAAILFASLLAFGRQNMAFVPFAEVASVVLIASRGGALAPLLRSPIAQALGRWSYAIYLWHHPLAFAFRPLGAWSIAVVLPLSIGLAALSFNTVEAWGRRIGARGLGERVKRPVDPAIEIRPT